MKIKSGLGAIFKTYNLLEYKSPDAALDLTVYYRSMGYGYLYLAYEGRNATSDEVTLTFIRERKPVKLIKNFKEMGFRITEYESGIYHIKKQDHVDMQIIVTGMLGKKYKWITKLSARLKKEDIEELGKETGRLEDERDKTNARSVFDLITRLNENKEWMEEMRHMGAFRDLFKEEFEQKDQRIAELSEQLQSKDEQLQSKDEQLMKKDEENSNLRKEIAQLKKQLGNRVAMF